MVLTGDDDDDVILEPRSSGLTVATCKLEQLLLCRTFLNMSTFPSLPDLVTNDSPVCNRQHIIVNMIEIIAVLEHLG